MTKPTPVQGSRTTRILHWLVGLAIITQLALSLVMRGPGQRVRCGA